MTTTLSPTTAVREKHGSFRIVLRINGVPYGLSPAPGGGRRFLLSKEVRGFEAYTLSWGVHGRKHWACTCPDCRKRGPVCKHGAALEAALKQLWGALE